MPRKIAGISVSIILAFISWAIPKYMDVKNMITPENANWLLYGSIGGGLIAAIILIWGFWSNLKHFISYIRQMRRPQLIPRWLWDAIDSDRRELATRIDLQSWSWGFYVDSTEPFIELEIKIRNLAVFPLKIVNTTGSFFIANTRCLQPITIKNANSLIKHLYWDTLVISQAISAETAVKIREYRDSNRPLPLNLVGCSLMVTSNELGHNRRIVEVALNRIQEEIHLLKL